MYKFPIPRGHRSAVATVFEVYDKQRLLRTYQPSVEWSYSHGDLTGGAPS